MRITNQVLVKGFLSDVNTNLQNMKKYQEQLSSGKEVRRPSDNPFKVSRAMELRTGIMVNDRYKNNIEESIGWLDTTETAMGQLTDSLQRLRELTVASGNGSYSIEEQTAVRKEIEQLKESIANIGNTSYDGRYVFGGDKTTNPPFKITSDTSVAGSDAKKVMYEGSESGIVKELSQGITIDVAVTGNLFTDGQDDTASSEGGIFAVVNGILDKLVKGETASSELEKLDEQINKALRIRADVGAKSNRLEAMMSRNEDETFNMTELLSKTEDIDLAEKVMQYKVAENVYTAALQTGAKILQPSLLDFLR